MTKSEKDLHITALEDEVRAARETILSLTKTIQELAKNVGDTHIHNHYQEPKYPYWWDGRTWFYQTPTIVSTGTSGTSGSYSISFPNDDDDDGDGIQVSNVS